jgi:hypothetical protein
VIHQPTETVIMVSSAVQGIYRARVLSLDDPTGSGRVQVLVPSISGQASGWAVPCLPGADASDMEIDDMVWVMFEGGDPTFPVVLGKLPD